jgi:lipopolysaccharide transport system permease protein
MLKSNMDIAAAPAKPFLTIQRRRGWAPLDLPELWRFRDLLLTLAGRDIKLRYRQTALGVAWVILQPLLAAGVFSFVFGKIAKLSSGGIPYFAFSYTGMLAFNIFNSTLTKSGTCLVGNAQLVSKVYFPRMLLPLSTAISSLLDFGVALALLPFMLLAYHINPGPGILLMPISLLLILMLAVGAGLFVSALTVSYRDVQYILPLILQLALYASPVGYAASEVPAKYVKLYFLNPLAAPLEAFRRACLGTGQLHWGYLAYAAAFAVASLLIGGLSFKKMERKFADVI